MLFLPIVLCHLLSIQVLIPVRFDDKVTFETFTLCPFFKTVANFINPRDIKKIDIRGHYATAPTEHRSFTNAYPHSMGQFVFSME